MTHIRRALVGLLAAASLGILAASPVAATGQANWQLTFAGTGQGFGFWGWCDLSGGTLASGTNGNCSFAEYVHSPAVSFNCEISVNLTGWWQAPGAAGTDFYFAGTAVTHPAGNTLICESFPGSPPPSFSSFDSLLPVAPGHTNLNHTGFFGTFELQINETPGH